MISTMTKRPQTREPGRVYIDELRPIIDREMGTIRKWERTILPKRLHSKRGHRGWRFWTDNQIWGKNGIIEWMEKNDMRPGKLMVPPEKTSEHIHNLRKPKYLDGHHIRSARHFADIGKSRQFIIQKLFPRTRYARPENLEAALEKLFDQEGWYFPPSLGKISMLPDRVGRKVKTFERDVEKMELRHDAQERTIQSRRRIKIRSAI
jgi:hypothetical protein